MGQNKEVYLNIGCGPITPAGWVNIDASPNAWLAKFPLLRKLLVIFKLLSKEHGAIPWSKNIKIHNVAKGLPYSDNSVSVIYASHLLEHLKRSTVEPFLKECYRVLKPGGVIRLVLPDLEAMAQAYLNGKKSSPPGDPAPAENFIQDLDQFVSCSGPLLYRLYEIFIRYDQHKWAYDTDSLSSLLLEAGFTEVQSTNCQESRIPNIKDVEHGPKRMSMYIEGSKALTELSE